MKAEESLLSGGLFAKLSALFRFANWWHYKIPLLIAIFFCAQLLSDHDANVNLFLELFLLILWMITAAAFGYFINDWSDTEEDLLAGKKNVVSVIDVSLRLTIAISLFFFSIFLQFLLNGFNSVPFFLSILHLLLFILYSADPFRLKRCLILAISCDSLYAHVLPAAIVFTSVNSLVTNYFFAFAILCLWMLVLGVKNILLHHIFDRKGDVLSGNINAANRFGPRCMLKNVNQILLPIDLFLGLLFFSIVDLRLAALVIMVVMFRFFLVSIVWCNKKLLFNKTLAYLVSNGIYEGHLPLLCILFFFHQYPQALVVMSLLYLVIFPKFTRSVMNDMQSLFRFFK